ncbi:MAG: dihydrodipicolinate synthase family protein [Pirellulaceae bacterium]
MKTQHPFPLIAAPYTPMRADGALNLDAVQPLANWLSSIGVTGAFIAGTTGEGYSLTFAERVALTERWAEAVKNMSLDLYVQVGGNCQRESIELAGHAQALSVAGIAALPPGYLRPASIEALIEYCEPIAAAAAKTSFYYYDIPSLSGVTLPAVELLGCAAERIPNLRGIKFSHTDLVQLQACVQFQGGHFEIYYGNDETLLAAYCLGAHGAIGSTYNFMAPTYHQLLAHADAQEWTEARTLQWRAATAVRLLARFGYLPASKSVMAMVGVDCGPVRNPLRNLSETEAALVRFEVEKLDVLPNAGK